MNNDKQLIHLLYWILVSMEYIKQEDRQREYIKMIADDYTLSKETCEDIDALVSYIKENY